MISLVIGAGVSGFGAAKLLRARGKNVRVSDGGILSPDKLAKFSALGIEVLHGGHRLDHLDGVSEIVISPGVNASHPLLTEAKNRGIQAVSEIDLAMASYNGTIYAVTGTNGKSTTCAMIHHVLQRLGIKSALAGNFGMPPSQILAEDGELPPHLVLELSSYQLEQTSGLNPTVSIFTSFSHDHMARHGSMFGYLQAKWRIFDHMKPSGLVLAPSEILMAANDLGLKLSPSINKIISDRSYICSLAPSSIVEPHNRLNAGFAIASVSHSLGLTPESIASKLNDFVGLRHRCELIGNINGHPCINDSKSTNVESTIVALEGQVTPVLLMMGGQGKGESYEPLLSYKNKIAAVITFGASGPDIARDLSSKIMVHEFPTLAVALSQIAGIISKVRSPVLFSPGCASFDEFDNYEHRGDVFIIGMKSFLDR